MLDRLEALARSQREILARDVVLPVDEGFGAVRWPQLRQGARVGAPCRIGGAAGMLTRRAGVSRLLGCGRSRKSAVSHRRRQGENAATRARRACVFGGLHRNEALHLLVPCESAARLREKMDARGEPS